MGDLIYPPFGYAAVVEGAVRHLQQPSTIFKRVSNMTYGVRVFLNWTRDMPESYKQWDTYYKAYVTDKAFLVAVKRGEPVEVGAGSRRLRDRGGEQCWGVSWAVVLDRGAGSDALLAYSALCGNPLE